jgi:hypothetical protein
MGYFKPREKTINQEIGNDDSECQYHNAQSFFESALRQLRIQKFKLPSRADRAPFCLMRDVGAT